jgi:hypothetical protein
VRSGKPAKSPKELTAIILSRLRPYVGGCALKVLIAPVFKPNDKDPNWRVAFTTGGRRAVPSIAWEIGSQVEKEFDLT